MLDEEFVELPPEKWKEGKCARLIYTLHGMCVAANWGKEYSKTLEEVGFQLGRATVVAFFHPKRDMQETSHTERHNVFGWVVGLEKQPIKVLCHGLGTRHGIRMTVGRSFANWSHIDQSTKGGRGRFVQPNSARSPIRHLRMLLFRPRRGGFVPRKQLGGEGAPLEGKPVVAVGTESASDLLSG